jgi:hypothetical protein
MSPTTLSLDTPVHLLPWWPDGPRQPRPALRTVVTTSLGLAVQEPYGRPLVWAHAPAEARPGQVVWAIWTDRLLAGTIPGTAVLCADAACSLPLYRRDEAGERVALDDAVRGPHYAVFDDLTLPGVELG